MRLGFTVSVWEGTVTGHAAEPSKEAGANTPERSASGALVLPLPDALEQACRPGLDPAVAAGSEVQALDGVAHNLPVQLTSFVGRDAEMTQVRVLLADSRLVTLTGAGGVGKTRLALQVAASLLPDFRAGVWLVDLAPLTESTLVPVAVARALDLVDTPGRSTLATITSFIGERRALLVLDNCEHLLQACATLTEAVLRACPGLLILSTSREPLGAAGEATWQVPSLPHSAAVDLLTDRAGRARPGFVVTAENSEAIAEICRRLDGIPLAIELAAARLRAFSPAEIAAGLHDRFRLLTGGVRTAPRRQQTLRASVDWSHALLTEPERVLFQRLAVFAGGLDLEAAKAVSAGDRLQPDEVLDLLPLLVDKSLVMAEEGSDGVTRYRLLETVRQYAAERLGDSAEADAVRARHRNHYSQLARRLDAAEDVGRRRMIRWLEADIDNLRAAFHWSLETSDHEAALRLASNLQPLWLGRCRMREGLAWFNAVLAARPSAEPISLEVRVRSLADAAVLAMEADAPLDTTQAEEAVVLARQLGDDALVGRALIGAGFAVGYLTEAAQPYFEEAIVLARKAGDSWAVAQILGRQAFVAYASGDLVAARSAGEEGLVLADMVGNDHASRQCRTWLGAALMRQGDLHRARSLLTGVIAEADADRNPVSKLLGTALLGEAAAYLGRPEEARLAAEASIAIANEIGHTTHKLAGYACLCISALASGNGDALREASQAGWQYARFRPELSVPHHIYMADAELYAADLPAASRHADQAVAEAARLGMNGHRMYALLARARVAVATGESPQGQEDAYEALAVARSIESKIGIIDALDCLGALAHDSESRQKAARLLGAAGTLRRTTGYQHFQLYQADYHAAVARLRDALGDEAFSRAWDEGTTLSLDDAVRYAQRGSRRSGRGRPGAGWMSLTPTERDVARLVAEGLANKDIATRLYVSPRTVQTHLTHIYGKLGVSSRVQLAQQADRRASDS
jgi:predicted ATPase/DNA-binding CsgD family transcriptional regulator